MSHPVKSCPKCGHDKLTDNGGADSHASAHAAHAFVHGFKHGNPLWFVLGTGMAAARVLNPKKFTCLSCLHVFKP
jgi:hypothetical protein